MRIHVFLGSRGWLRCRLSSLGCWLSAGDPLKPQLNRCHEVPGLSRVRNLSIRAPRFSFSVGTGEWMAFSGRPIFSSGHQEEGKHTAPALNRNWFLGPGRRIRKSGSQCNAKSRQLLASSPAHRVDSATASVASGDSNRWQDGASSRASRRCLITVSWVSQSAKNARVFPGRTPKLKLKSRSGNSPSQNDGWLVVMTAFNAGLMA